ncbi:hypothetical protein [Paenibacillus segetis]|nr:hypothetical protein [Paenibacillus segetis]
MKGKWGIITGGTSSSGLAAEKELAVRGKYANRSWLLAARGG